MRSFVSLTLDIEPSSAALWLRSGLLALAVFAPLASGWPWLTAVLICAVCIVSFSLPTWARGMLRGPDRTDRLQLRRESSGLVIRIGDTDTPLKDAWMLAGIDVLYPRGRPPIWLWPDSIVPAQRAALRALLNLSTAH